MSVFCRRQIDPFTWTDCKFAYIFSIIFVGHYSSALLVLMSVEKFLAIYFPFKTKSICTVKVAKRVTFLTSLIFVACESQFFFIIEADSKNECVSVRVSKIYELTCNHTDAALYSFGPFTIMTLTNCAIIAKILKAICQNRQGSTESTNQALSKFAGKRTAMLITISITFIILTGPVSVIYFITVDPHPRVRVLTFALSDLNHAINGVLYCIVGSHFRNELVKVLPCWKHRSTKHRGTGSVSVSVTDNSRVFDSTTATTLSSKDITE